MWTTDLRSHCISDPLDNDRVPNTFPIELFKICIKYFSFNIFFLFFSNSLKMYSDHLIEEEIVRTLSQLASMDYTTSGIRCLGNNIVQPKILSTWI